MKLLLAIVTAALWASAAYAQAPRALLFCKGVRVYLNGRGQAEQIAAEHRIAIYATTADVDGDTYALSETPLEFTMTSRSGPKVVIHVDRLKGDYYIDAAIGSNPAGPGPEYNADGTVGCKPARQKF